MENLIVNPYKIRSWIVFPSIKKNFIEKVLNFEGEYKPDAVMFDLEDSVHPDFKKEAREVLRDYLYGNKEYREELFRKYIGSVRINSYETNWFKEDLDLVNEIGFDFLVLPKVESPDQVRYVRGESETPQLFIAVETIKGFENRERIMKEMEWYDVFIMGYEDLSTDLFIERPEYLDSANPLTTILMNSVISARKNDITMVDAVSRKYGTPENLKELEKECLFTRGLGLSSKVAIHPSQVPIINSVFDKKSLLEKAERVLGKFEELKDGSFVISDDKKEMMDTPSYKLYSNILELWNRK